MLFLFLAAVLAALTVPADARAARRGEPREGAPLTIVALGDSLTSGHRLPAAQAYPARLESALRDEGLPFRVVNHGVSGDTTAGALRRLDAALAERPQILIVALGANDGLRGVPVPQVRSNLDRIVSAARTQGVQVLLCGMDALPLYGWQYTLDFHRVFPDLAARYDVPLVPFLLQGVIGNRDLMSSDGIHPNAAGAQTIADTVLTYVRPLAEAVVRGTR